MNFADGESLKRIPYDGQERCHDCNVLRGQLHHPGCDVERCPRCGSFQTHEGIKSYELISQLEAVAKKAEDTWNRS